MDSGVWGKSLIYYTIKVDHYNHWHSRASHEAFQMSFTAGYRVFELMKWFEKRGIEDYSFAIMSDHGG